MSEVAYSIVVPVYNSTDSVVELCGQLVCVFEDTVKESFEIILVDDGSPNQDTWHTLEQLHEKDNRVKVIQLMRNFGQQPAMLCGFKYSKGEYIITMDDDLQHPPEEIPKFIKEKKHDVVIAQFKQRHHGFVRGFFSRIKQWFDYKILDKPKGLHLSSFRLLSRGTVDNILRIRTAYPFVGAMIFMVTRDIKGVEAQHNERTHGTSGYTFSRMFRLFLNLLINNSTLLLNTIGALGVVISILSFLLGGLVIIKKIFWGVSILGWSSLMALNSFIGGMVLLSVSIIGEYLIRIIHEVQGKPVYTVRQLKI